MKLVFVSRESFPLDGSGQKGGIGRYVETTSRALAKAGVTVSVLAESTDSTYHERRVDEVLVHYLPKWIADSRVDSIVRRVEPLVFSIPLIGKWWSILSTKFRRSCIVSRFIENYSSVHEWDCIEFAECGAEGFIYLLKRKRLPAGIRVHGPTQMLCDIKGLRKTLGLKTLILAERLAAKSADFITAPSEFAATMATRVWKLTETLPAIVFNYINTEAFRPPSTQKIRNGSIPTVFYSGRLEMVKGVSHIPAILSELAKRGLDINIRLAGNDTQTAPGGRSMKEWILANTESDLRRRIVFLGNLGQKDLVSELQNADIGLYLSTTETFGYTCLEAQCCGLPVIATRAGALSEMVVDGATGFLVNNGNISTICDKIELLIRNDTLRQQMSMQAQTNAQKKFSIQKNTAMLRDTYAKRLDLS